MALTAPREIMRLRSYQKEPRTAYDRGIRRFLTLWHRRAGKDRSWCSFTLEKMLQRQGVYFHIFPSLNQGRRDLWDNVLKETIDGVERSITINDMFPPELVIGSDEGEMQKKLINGSIWQVMGADNDEAIARMRGPNPIAAILSEFSHGSKMEKAYDTLSPIFAENGGWIALPYTPNGPNHGKKFYDMAGVNHHWYCDKQTVDNTRRDARGESGGYVITPEMIDQFRKEGQREEFIQQEYYCSFTGYSHGTIYGDLLTDAITGNRVSDFPFVPTHPVGTIWDLGRSDAQAVWFYQKYGPAIYFIDYHEETQKNLQWWTRYLRESKRYVYGRMVLPWDGRDAEDYFSTVGFRNIHVCQRPVSLQLEIDAVRRAFTTFYFNKTTCGRGLECLENYKRDYDEDARVFSKEPVHNQYSHGADALRTGVSGGFDPIDFAKGLDTPVKVESTFDPRTFGVDPKTGMRP